MRNFLLFTILTFFITSFTIAQEISNYDWKSMSKKEKKTFRKYEQEKAIGQTIEIIQSKEWILEAEWLIKRTGKVQNIDKNLNLVCFIEENAVIQYTGSSPLGENGFGGGTYGGEVSSFHMEILNTNKQRQSFKFTVKSKAMGLVTVVVVLGKDGIAQAYIDNIDGPRLILKGYIKPLNESKAFVRLMNNTPSFGWLQTVRF